MTSVTRLQIATAHAENINKSTSAPDPITRRSRFVPSGIVIPSKHKFQLFFKLVPIPHSSEDTSRSNFHHVRGRLNFRPIVENKIARSFLYFLFFWPAEEKRRKWASKWENDFGLSAWKSVNFRSLYTSIIIISSGDDPRALALLSGGCLPVAGKWTISFSFGKSFPPQNDSSEDERLRRKRTLGAILPT